MSDIPRKPLLEQNTEFAGNLLINTRTIVRTNQLFDNITSAPRRKDTITVSELTELLLLLEAIATSSQLVYDLTVPARDIEGIKAAENELEQKIGNSDVFNGIRPKTDKELLKLAKGSIQQSSAVLRKQLKIFSSKPTDLASSLPGVTPLKGNQIEDAQLFRQELCRPVPAIDELEEVAINLIEDNAFMGAKCVAGILTTESQDDYLSDPGTDDDIRSLCRSVAANCDDEELSWLVPALINGFRSNFLNSLGAEYGRAAFFAGPDIAHVLDQQIFVLSSFVAAKLSQTKIESEILESALADRFKNTNQFPFLGLLLLLSAEDDEPYSLFQDSFDDRNKLLAEFLAKKGGGKRFIHDFTAAELSEFKEEKLGRIFERMQKRVDIHGGIDRFNQNFIQPCMSWYPLFRLLFNAGGGNFEIDVKAPEIPSGGAPTVEYVLNQTLMPDQYLSYKTFTQSIKNRLNLALKNRGTQDIITERVKSVLGCELVPD